MYTEGGLPHLVLQLSTRKCTQSGLVFDSKGLYLRCDAVCSFPGQLRMGTLGLYIAGILGLPSRVFLQGPVRGPRKGSLYSGKGLYTFGARGLPSLTTRN